MKDKVLDDSVNDLLSPQDVAGDIAYEASFRLRRTLQVFSAGLLVALMLSVAGNVYQARRPPIVVVDRVDEAGRAEAVRYSGLSYSPREAEIRARLNDWALDRYRLLKAVAGDTFKLNYDFLSSRLAQELMQQDVPRVAKILAGTAPEQDVSIENIQFTAIGNQSQPDGAVASGEAVIDMIRMLNPGDQEERQHWTVTVRYEVDPVAAAKRGESDPQFLNVNPLGITVTWFHEDRAFR